MRLKFEVLFFTLRKSKKHHFSRKNWLTKTEVYFTGSEIYLLAKIFFFENPVLKVESILIRMRLKFEVIRYVNSFS
jgi:hypothetical protein